MNKFRQKVLQGFLLPIILTLSVVSCDLLSPEANHIPEILTISDYTLRLETFLYRDFMPGDVSDSLIAVITVVEVDSLLLPDSLDVIGLSVIKGKEIWHSGFTDEVFIPRPSSMIRKIARGGPRWQTGIFVDVVVDIRFGKEKSFRLKARKQKIYAVILE